MSLDTEAPPLPTPSRGPDWVHAVATFAIVVFAVILLYMAYRILHLIVQLAWHLAGKMAEFALLMALRTVGEHTVGPSARQAWSHIDQTLLQRPERLVYATLLGLLLFAACLGLLHAKQKLIALAALRKDRWRHGLYILTLLCQFLESAVLFTCFMFAYEQLAGPAALVWIKWREVWIPSPPPASTADPTASAATPATSPTPSVAAQPAPTPNATFIDPRELAWLVWKTLSYN